MLSQRQAYQQQLNTLQTQLQELHKQLAVACETKENTQLEVVFQQLQKELQYQRSVLS